MAENSRAGRAAVIIYCSTLRMPGGVAERTNAAVLKPLPLARPSATHRLRVPDPEGELLQALRPARQLLATGAVQAPDPGHHGRPMRESRRRSGVTRTSATGRRVRSGRRRADVSSLP